MSPSFFDIVCAYRRLLWYAFRLVIVLLLLSLFSIAFIDRGTESYYIGLVNIAIQVSMLVVVSSFLYVCERRTERKTVDAVDETGDDAEKR